MAAGEKEGDEPQLRMPTPIAAARLPFRLQRLEPPIGYAAGAVAVWSAMLLNPDGPTVWLLAVFAAAIAAWASAYLAQHPAMMFLRAALLQAGGWWLLTAPGFGGPTGPALLWPLTVTVGYALLLPLRWSLPMGALALATFIAAAFSDHAGLSWQLALAFAGALGALPIVALVMGRSFRRGELEAEGARVDPGTRLYNEAGFFANGSVLFDECRRDGRPFTLVLLKAGDLREAAEVLGRHAANQLFAQTVHAIAAVTPPRGLAARTDTAEFAMAMPGVGADRADALLRQRLGQPLQVKVQVGGSEAAIVLDAVIAQAPGELHTLEDLYDRLHRELRRRADPPPTAPMTDSSLLSTLQGLLAPDPQLPSHQRPTLPMPLPGRPGARPGNGRDSAA